MIKKITVKVPAQVLVEVCKWCDGRGWTSGIFGPNRCLMCRGSGGKWKDVMVVKEILEVKQ